MRKSHRIDIPLEVIINHKKYNVPNWSATGFRIDKLEGVMLGEEVETSVVLSVKESAIILYARVKIRHVADTWCGVEFVSLSDKNKRVLRHYATLAIEGNLDHIDDLSSDIFMTNIETPIKEPIALTDIESTDIHKAFIKKLLYYLLFATVFVLFVFYTLLYHYLILEEENAIVTGNVLSYKAPFDGAIELLHVKQEDSVKIGELLFKMDTSKLKETQNNLKKERKALLKRVNKSQKLYKKLQERYQKKSLEIDRMSQQIMSEFEEEYQEQNDNYKRAKVLYDKRLLTYVKFLDIQGKYRKFMHSYREQKAKNYTSKEKLLAQQALLKTQDQMIATNKSVHSINDSIQNNSLEILEIKQKIDRSFITARLDGVVHNIIHKSGEMVKFSDDILIEETRTQPYIITKISKEKVTQIHIGEKVLLHYDKDDSDFSGRIVALGDVQNNLLLNRSSSDVIVKIKIDNDRSDLRLNEYIKVYFINDSQLSKDILAFFPLGIIVL